jgi:hypothetical protein
MSIWLDLHGDDYTYLDSLIESERRYGPCTDDREYLRAPYPTLPDESSKEGGSPLKF